MKRRHDRAVVVAVGSHVSVPGAGTCADRYHEDLRGGAKPSAAALAPEARRRDDFDKAVGVVSGRVITMCDRIARQSV